MYALEAVSVGKYVLSFWGLWFLSPLFLVYKISFSYCLANPTPKFPTESVSLCSQSPSRSSTHRNIFPRVFDRELCTIKFPSPLRGEQVFTKPTWNYFSPKHALIMKQSQVHCNQIQSKPIPWCLEAGAVQGTAIATCSFGLTSSCFLWTVNRTIRRICSGVRNGTDSQIICLSQAAVPLLKCSLEVKSSWESQESEFISREWLLWLLIIKFSNGVPTNELLLLHW